MGKSIRKYVCELAVILPRPQSVNNERLTDKPAGVLGDIVITDSSVATQIH